MHPVVESSRVVESGSTRELLYNNSSSFSAVAMAASSHLICPQE